MSNSLFNTAIKLKGYGSFKDLAKSEYNKIQQTKIVDKNLKVKPTIITCLKDYFEFIKTLESSYENPVFRKC